MNGEFELNKTIQDGRIPTMTFEKFHIETGNEEKKQMDENITISRAKWSKIQTLVSEMAHKLVAYDPALARKALNGYTSISDAHLDTLVAAEALIEAMKPDEKEAAQRRYNEDLDVLWSGHRAGVVRESDDSNDQPFVDDYSAIW